MTTKLKVILALISLALIFVVGCERNSQICSDLIPSSAALPVEVDWSRSNVDDVHKLSLRFYPESGGQPIVRYLEGDVTYGTVDVPIGRYSVVAINESIDDGYWDGVFNFTSSDSYEDFAVELVTDEDSMSSEAKALAAWATASFEMTERMIIHLCGISPSVYEPYDVTLTSYDLEQLEALTKVVMMPRTKSLTVKVTTENLGSARSIVATVTGLSRVVNIVTGESESDPVAHKFLLDNYEYATRASGDDGVASGDRLTLAHSDDTQDYTLDLDVTMNDGTTHTDAEQLEGVDIADQVTSTADDDNYLIEHSISLPEVKESIDVSGWEDGGNINLN